MTTNLLEIKPFFTEPISVIVPVYNSTSTLPVLVQRLSEVLEATGVVYEIILVNDGSQDQSWTVITSLEEVYPRVSGLNLMRNYGQHNALLAGIRQAKYSVSITIDDDLQHPPEEIPRLLEKLSQGFDVVYGSPSQEQHGIWRDIASRLTKAVLQAAMGVDMARKVSAFRAFRTEIREGFANYYSSFVSIDVLLTWGTTNFGSVEVRHDPRLAGVSNYTFRKLLIHSLNMMTGFTTLPLQLASLTGFAFTLFGIGVLIYVFVRFLIHGRKVPGFPFLASIIAIFSGVELFSLGVMGEYLARMHFRMMGRPAYVIRKKNKIGRT